MDFTKEAKNDGTLYKWSNVTESDTPLTTEVPSGKYTVNVEGSYGADTSIEVKYGLLAGNEATVQDNELVFTANGSKNIEMAGGFILPVRTGSNSATINISLIPILRYP